MSKQRVLVVDDEKMVCESCTSILPENEFKVETTLSARDGLRKIVPGKYSLLVIDLKMPEMDGVEMLESLQKKSPDTAVMVITEVPSVETAVQAIELGALEYLAKPFTPEEFLTTVRKAIAKAQSRRESDLHYGSKNEKAVSASAVNPKARSGVLTIDLNACMSCQSCEVECGAAHCKTGSQAKMEDQPDWEHLGEMMDNARIRVEAVGSHCVPMKCNQCENAPCVAICPTGAISKQGANQAVIVDDERCIGCKSCVLACPFGCMYINGKSNMVIKCDFCRGIVEPDEDPVCVSSCPSAAIRFVPAAEAGEETRLRAAKDLMAASLERNNH